MIDETRLMYKLQIQMKRWANDRGYTLTSLSHKQGNGYRNMRSKFNAEGYLPTLKTLINFANDLDLDLEITFTGTPQHKKRPGRKRVYTEEYKRLMSERLKRQWAEGVFANRKKRRLTPQQKEELRQRMIIMNKARRKQYE